MNKLKETMAMIEKIKNNPTMSNEIMFYYIFVDIAKSLAIIADKLQEKNNVD